MAHIGRKFFGGDPLKLPSDYGVYGETELKNWPWCFACTSRMNFVTRVPVQVYGATDHKPRSLNCSKLLEVFCKCHGRTQSALIDVPVWWSEEFERVAISRLMFFGPEKPETKDVQWLGTYGSK